MLLHIFQFFYNYHFYSCSQKSFIEYKIISPRFESRNYIYPNGAHWPQKERVWRGEADVPLGPASAEPPAEWVFESDLGCSVNVRVNSWRTVWKPRDCADEIAKEMRLRLGTRSRASPSRRQRTCSMGTTPLPPAGARELTPHIGSFACAFPLISPSSSGGRRHASFSGMKSCSNNKTVRLKHADSMFVTSY